MVWLIVVLDGPHILMFHVHWGRLLLWLHGEGVKKTFWWNHRDCRWTLSSLFNAAFIELYLYMHFQLQEDLEKMEVREKLEQEQNTQKKLFEGLKFFLNREVPRESLAFVIRWRSVTHHLNFITHHSICGAFLK